MLSPSFFAWPPENKPGRAARRRHASHAWLKTPSVRLSQNLYMSGTTILGLRISTRETCPLIPDRRLQMGEELPRANFPHKSADEGAGNIDIIG
jgi:hypothetical protein